MTKNVIIGIGGTGLSAIRELRRLMAERYENGLKDAAVSSTRFVYVDTDRDFAKTLPSWDVLGKDISLQENEMAIITGDQLGPFVQRPADYPEFSAWLPSIKDEVGDPGKGAKGIRPYGRLIFEYADNKNLVCKRLTDAITELSSAFPYVRDLRIYLVTGLSGGTGSGMFLPLASSLLEWHLFTKEMQNQRLCGMLVMPPLAITGRPKFYHANAYAALEELNYRAVEGTLPFSNTYLLEPGTNVGLDNLPLMIAQRMLLDIEGGSAAAKMDGQIDNHHLGGIENEHDSRRKHALAFSTFGLATVSYPREMIARSVGSQWGTAMVESWLKERDEPKNVNEVVRNDLPKLKLSQLHINGDADPFGNKDYGQYDTDLSRDVDAKFGPLLKRQVGTNAQKLRQEIQTAFRGTGISEFYQQREKDVKRAGQFALAQVRLSISRQVRDPDRGLQYAKAYLEELGKILESEFKVEAAQRFGPNAQKQVGNWKTNYDNSANTTALHESKLVYFDGDFTRDKNNCTSDLKGYLKREAGYWSAKYAIGLLDEVIPAVRALRASMDVWEAKVQETLGKMRARVRNAVEGRSQGPKENGQVIFDAEILNSVAAEAPAELVNAALEERLRLWLVARWKRDFADLDLFALMEDSDPDEAINRIAFEYILSMDSPINIRRTTLYDRFLKKYPKPDMQRQMLKQTLEQSSVFNQWTPKEFQRRKNEPGSMEVVSIPDVPGTVTRENQEAKTVIREALHAAGVTDDKIMATADFERIVFLREKHAFPIRNITSVAELRKKYDKVASKDSLHIDRQEIDKLYDLYLLSDEDREAIEEAEEVFVLARSNAWLKLETNPMTHKQEIRLVFQPHGSIAKKTANFGQDWDTAFDRFSQDPTAPAGGDPVFSEGRMYLTDKVRLAKQSWKTDRDLWLPQYELLKTYLDGTLETYKAGTEDPRYKRDVRVIERIEKQNQ